MLTEKSWRGPGGVDVNQALRVMLLTDGPHKGTCFTTGMQAFGFPELLIRDIPLIMILAGGAMLNIAADYMLNGGREVRPGEGFHIAAFRFTIRPIPEEELATGYAALTSLAHVPVWELAEIPSDVGRCPAHDHDLPTHPSTSTAN